MSEKIVTYEKGSTPNHFIVATIGGLQVLLRRDIAVAFGIVSGTTMKRWQMELVRDKLGIERHWPDWSDDRRYR